MLRSILLLLGCFLLCGFASAQLSGTYEYVAPGVGRSQIVFKPGKQFEYSINNKSGVGSYKKRGKKYHLDFKGYDTNPLASSFWELVKENESKGDSMELKIRVFDNSRFDSLVGSVVLVTNTKSDTTSFGCATDFDGRCSIKIPKNFNEISLNVSYSLNAVLNTTFKMTQDMTINVYLSCIVFNQVTDGCLVYEGTDKMTLKIRQKDKNGILIRFPQAKSKYKGFLKID